MRSAKRGDVFDTPGRYALWLLLTGIVFGAVRTALSDDSFTVARWVGSTVTFLVIGVLLGVAVFAFRRLRSR